jgi:hypothetical protein
MNIRNEIILPSEPLTVTHEPTTGDPGRTLDGLTVYESERQPTILTTVIVSHGEKNRKIYLYWTPQSWNPHVCLLFIAESSTLFIGGGTFSATINMDESRLISQHTVDLFWSFQTARNSILELGEIECFLYRHDGTLIGLAPVDPPYDVVVHEHRVEFISAIFGSQCIQFPTD